MKPFLKRFFKQGMVAAWAGPVVVAIVYAILGLTGVVEFFAVREVCMAIISSTLMAFIAAGIPAVYHMEKLPLPMAIMIHCAVLYIDYLLVYLLNGWLQNQVTPIVVFTVIFVVGFALTWLIIYQFIKKDIKQLNRKLQAQ